jgi:hypothetical protein
LGGEPLNTAELTRKQHTRCGKGISTESLGETQGNFGEKQPEIVTFFEFILENFFGGKKKGKHEMIKNE